MVRLTVELTESMLDNLVRQAIVYGWLRDDPNKRMTLAEKKTAARFALKRMMHEDKPL